LPRRRRTKAAARNDKLRVWLSSYNKNRKLVSLVIMAVSMLSAILARPNAGNQGRTGQVTPAQQVTA
jgi:hypothetical protein